LLTKSDFLIYLDAPLHLWAAKHDRIEKAASPFSEHLMRQGFEVEQLARKYFEEIIQDADIQLLWQQTFSEQDYLIRSDALLHNKSDGVYDLYEVKSGTALKPEYIYDAAFQTLILRKTITLQRIFLLHLNPGYIRIGSLDLAQLFVSEDITDRVNEIRGEVELLRENALRTASSDSPDLSGQCWSPRECPCPQLCHPNLPDFSIYDIPGLNRKKKMELLETGIIKAKDIPETFPLNARQRLIVKLAKTGQESIDRQAIRREMEKFIYPIYFLDYETCISAIPLYTGCHPQQQMVFQYSLFRMDIPDGEIAHSEYLSVSLEEISKSLLEHLTRVVGDTGTVFVWNKTFEITRNRELAAQYPQYAMLLNHLNERIYDLGDFVSRGLYLHPGFKGSWSLKNVLPVMVPGLKYEDMEIGNGEEAMLAWWNLAHGQMPEAQVEPVKQALLRYCELDTLAMVYIWKKLYYFGTGG